MGTLFFVIVMLHLVAGFGWVLYKLTAKKEKNDTEI
jgi:hypothetical protein